jgi:asparagine synthase (glutamine-hydrolysing)
MTDRSRHRGFRSTTTSYFDGSVWLSHVRLPIQGTSEDDDHPITYRDFDGAMVGEVLNFRDFDPDATTDLRVVLRRWAEWDDKPMSLLPYDGFWSMVFVDKEKETVTVVVDPLGKKPLYMRTVPSVAISSEIDPLLEVGPVTVDESYFGGVMKWGYVHDGSTPYREIRAVPRSRIIEFDRNGKVKQIRPYDVVAPVEGDLRKMMETAVKNRLVSDVPVSLLLSGGLDSTIIFELTKRHTTDFTVFHVDNDESEFLDYLDFPAGVKVVPISLEEVDVVDAIRSHQVPVDLGSVVPQYALGRAIRAQGFSVAISGDGADELFGGYRRAREFDSQHSDVFHELVHYHLPKLDRTMMASTVELRCPFLSWPVVCHALTIPWRHRHAKEELKQVFSDVVPQPILDREKIPLKIRGIRGEKKIEWRRAMVEKFRTEVIADECR